jgi:CMP-N,N'-diacetyllegionaminic acid synthase
MIRKELLIIIPARSGSSELKNKNIVKIKKKPLIFYTCAFANKIKNKNYEVIGSTDTEKISRIFNKYKIKTPFLRPKKISKKYSLDISYVNHAINFFYKKDIRFKFGLILRVTSPIRKASEFSRSFNIIKKNKNASSVKSIVLTPQTPYKMWLINKKRLKPLLFQKKKEMYNMPRQLLPKIYFQDGAFDYFKINYKNKLNSINGNNIFFFKRNNKYLLDIDTPKDLLKIK